MILGEEELRQSARKLLARLPDASPAQAWYAIVEAGWPALTAPETFGGLAQPPAAAAWLYAELGRALSPVPLLPSLLAIDTLRACAASPARDGWIERIAGGEPIAISLLGPNTGRISSDTLQAVINAGQASHVLVAATDPPCISLVPLGSDTATITPTGTWDATRALSDVKLSVTSNHVGVILASGAAALHAATVLSTHLHFAIAADCVGAAEAVLEQTVGYLKDRRQFDRPLALFQALKHRCADLKVTIAAATALLADYLRDIDDQPAETRALRSRGAKSIASRAFRATAEDAIQLHGGMGMTMEHTCHLFLKRALLNEQLGSADDAGALAVGRAVMAER